MCIRDRTGTAHYREPFEPLMGGVKFADFNDLASVKAQITDKNCAIITEVVPVSYTHLDVSKRQLLTMGLRLWYQDRLSMLKRLFLS